jgi:hypothetical protein
MIKIPEDTPKRSSRKMKAGELAYYESLEADFRKAEADKAAKRVMADDLQELCNRSLSRAIRRAMNPKEQLPVEIEKMDAITLKRLHAFQDVRNSVPSPRWENELKAKFGKGT